MRTLLALRNAVRDFIDEDDEARWTDTELTVYINSAYKFLVAEINNSEATYYEKLGTVTTSADTETASLPTDFAGTIINFTDDNGVPLRYTSKNSMVRNRFNTTNQKPSSYDFFGGESAIFYPTPDAIYSFPITYLYAPADLSGDLDTIVFPINYEILIVLEAVIFCKLKDHQKLASAGGLYETKKREMLKNIQPKQKFRSARVRCPYVERSRLT